MTPNDRKRVKLFERRKINVHDILHWTGLEWLDREALRRLALKDHATSTSARNTFVPQRAVETEETPKINQTPKDQERIIPLMKWHDAEALIKEIRKLKCKKGHMFLDRMDAMQPAVLLHEDAEYLQWLYRYAAGGLSVHVIYHDRH